MKNQMMLYIAVAAVIAGGAGFFGTTNSDGSVTAQDVQINPIFRGILGDSGISK